MSMNVSGLGGSKRVSVATQPEQLSRPEVIRKLLINPLMKNVLEGYYSLLSSDWKVVYNQADSAQAFSDYLAEPTIMAEPTTSSEEYSTLYDRIKNKKERQPKSIEEVMRRFPNVDDQAKGELETLLRQLDVNFSLQTPCNQVIASVFPEFAECIDQFYVLIDKGIIDKEQQRYNGTFLPGFVPLMLTWGVSWPDNIKESWKEFSLQFLRVLSARDEIGFIMQLTNWNANHPMCKIAWQGYEDTMKKLKDNLKPVVTHCCQLPQFQEVSKLALSLVKCVSMSQQKALEDKAFTCAQIILCDNFFSVSSWAFIVIYYDSKNREYPSETRISPEADQRLYGAAQYLLDSYNYGSYLAELEKLSIEDIKKDENRSIIDKEIFALNTEVQEVITLLKKHAEIQDKGDVIVNGQVVLGRALVMSFHCNELWSRLEKLEERITGIEKNVCCNTSFQSAEISKYLFQLMLINSNLKGLAAAKVAKLSQLELYGKDQQYDWRWEVWEGELQEQQSEDPEARKEAQFVEEPVKQEEPDAPEASAGASAGASSEEVEEPMNLLVEQFSDLFIQKDDQKRLRDIHVVLSAIMKAQGSQEQGAFLVSVAERKRIIEEIKAHLFLSCQNLLQAKGAFEQGKFLKEGHSLSLHQAALDAYIAIEKILNLYRSRENAEKQIAHDFSLPLKRPTYSKGVEDFLMASNKGTLAVRYPYRYSQEIPTFLRPLYDEKKSIQDKLLAIAQLIEYTLEIVNTLPDRTQVVSEVSEEINQLIEQLKTIEIPLQNKGKFLEDEEQIQKAVSELMSAVGDKFVVTRCVKQIKLYVEMLIEGRKFNRTHQEGDKDLFTRTRNLFLIGKVFEELFVFIHNTERTKPSDIHNLEELMQEVEKHIKLPEEIKTSLQAFNIGNYGHYLFTRAAGIRKDALSEAYRASLNQITIDEAGFKKEDSTLGKTREAPHEDYKALQKHHDTLCKHLPLVLREVVKFYQKSTKR